MRYEGRRSQDESKFYSGNEEKNSNPDSRRSLVFRIKKTGTKTGGDEGQGPLIVKLSREGGVGLPSCDEPTLKIRAHKITK